MKYKQIFTIVVTLVVFLGFLPDIAAQDDPAEDKGAEKTHKSLKKLPSSMLKSLGLSQQEAAQSTRGPKLKVYMLGIDELDSFKSGNDTKKLLVNTKETVYPVYVGKTLHTSLSIRKGKNGWKNASMGGAEIHYVEPMRNTHSRANNIDTKSYFIVRVPAMYLSFLGYKKGNDLYLIPTQKHPDLNIASGQELPAEEVYKKIQPLVAKYRNVLIRSKR